MPHSASVRRDEDDALEEDEEEEDDDEEGEEPPPRRRARTPPRRGQHRRRPPPVRRWRESESDEEDEEEEEEENRPSAPRGLLPSRKKPTYWRARDSLFFEPLVALAIIVVLLVSLFAYTQNWPPVYVVESNSMQHGLADRVGLINTGDLVLAQKLPLSGITPYVAGLQTGYSTYGEYGDVILYWANGQGSTPIIHRAILYLQWDPAGFYNAMDLNGTTCQTPTGPTNWAYSTPGTPQNCGTTNLTNEIVLHDIGWQSANFTLTLSPALLGEHSGFVTMGDNNLGPDQPSRSALVEPGWIIGVARGMIPWFGSVKLLLQGQAGDVPPQSWQFMGLTIVGVILVAFGIHYAFRREGIETPLRRKEEEEEARSEAESAPAEESGPRRWLSTLRRRRPEDEEEEEAEKEAPQRRRTRPPPSHTPSRRGRPEPHVRRAEKPPKKRRSDDEL